MKNKWLLLSLCAGYSFALCAQNPENDPVLMKVNGKSIKKSEFEYIYKKNNQQQTDPKSLDEYLELFKNYKLKVAEAEACGLDTTRAFRTELAGYRAQLVQPYLVDREMDDRLAKEAYDRLKENVEVSHILFRVNPGMTDTEKDKVYQKAKFVLERIRKGEDFGKLAKEYSEDPSVKRNGGYLGYIGGFMTVYPFETAAYTTPVGSVSEPILSQFGYHLIKVSDRRPDPGERLTAHIMLMLPSNASDEVKKEKEKQIREIYQQIIQGADFAELAKEKSEDKNSAQRGGELPWISTGRIVKEYEDAAYALKNKGDVSEPVLTPYGWHIIKLLDTRGLKPFEELKPDIMRRIGRDERSNKGQKSLIEKLKVEYAFNMNAGEKAKLEKFAVETSPMDTLFLNNISKDQSVLFSLDGKNWTVADLGNFMKNSRSAQGAFHGGNVAYLNKQIDAFVDNEILHYEDTKLESKYPEFRNLMNEYRDGILLFDISNREVWEKASNDVAGLQKYFKAHKKQYTWDQPRYKGYLIQCDDKALVKTIKKRIKSLPADSVVFYVNKEFNTDSIKHVKIEKGLFQKGDNKKVDNLAFKEGELSVDEKFPVVFVVGKMLKKGPESYTDMKGQVTADYQNYLEKIWVQNLNKKYPVEINKDVLKTVNVQ